MATVLIANRMGAGISAGVIKGYKHPSLLASEFGRLAGFADSDISPHRRGHSGSPPRAFVVPEVFPEGDGVNIPRVLRSQFEFLTTNTGYEFIRHWAYEWEKLQESSGLPRHPYLAPFTLGSRGRSQGVLLSVASELAKASFLRTIAYAMDEWGLPEKIALSYALSTSPLCVVLSNTFPRPRPQWVAAVSPSVDEQRIADKTVEIWRQASAAYHPQNILAMSGPVVVAEEAILDVAFIPVASESEPPEADRKLVDALAHPIESIHTGRTCILPKARGNYDVPAGVRPLTFSLWPMDTGWWQVDLLSRGPRLPFSTDNVGLQIEPIGDAVQIRHDGGSIGALHFWSNDWHSLHYPDVGPGVGTVSLLDNPLLLCTRSEQLVMYWSATLLRRTRYSEKVEVLRFYGVLDRNEISCSPN